MPATLYPKKKKKKYQLRFGNTHISNVDDNCCEASPLEEYGSPFMLLNQMIMLCRDTVGFLSKTFFVPRFAVRIALRWETCKK